MSKKMGYERNIILGLLILTIGILVAARPAKPKPTPRSEPKNTYGDTISASKYFLKDEKGNVRAMLVLDENNEPKLSFFSNEGKARIIIGQTDNEPGLTIYDRNGKVVFLVSQMIESTEEITMLSIGDNKNSHILMGAGIKNTIATLMIRDKQGNIIWSANEKMP